MPLVDRFGRPLRSLRVSVTDRCNLRCHYCMPEADYAWLPRETLLTFEEIGGHRRTRSPRSASTGSGSPAASRCCGATCRRSSRSSPRSPAVARPGADHQRRAARATGGGAARAPGCTASPSASTRCDRERFEALTRVRRARRGPRRHRRGRRAGFDVAQDRHRRHARRQRRRARAI